MISMTGCAINNTSSVVKDKDVEKEAISLSTPSGVVLVGTISQDKNGWYFIPEQPLNIELTYYIDNPEIFDNVIRLEMLSNSEDGFDKVIYQKQIVTITGVISNYRGLGKLYLVPYKIEVGKNVSKSYAVVDLQSSSYEQADYDSKTLPAKMKPIIENDAYIYNPYLLSLEALEMYGNDFADFYITFVDAYLNYETSIDCPNKKYADYLSTIIYYENPMFNMDISYNSFNWYDSDNHLLSWNYTKDKEEHNHIITQLEDAINSFLIGITPSDTEKDKAKKLFNNFNQKMEYDFEALKTRENIEPYYAYVDYKGICITFALAYSQLLTNIGIENTISSGMGDNEEGHVWNMITIDGVNYFVDPTYQITTKKTDRYYYFGMSLSNRLNDGSGFNKEEISVGRYVIKSLNDINISNQKLN